MATTDRPRGVRGVRRLQVASISILVFGIWLSVALLPVLAMSSPWFHVRGERELHHRISILSQLGTYGDMFGCVNSLFTAFALVVALYTLRLQIREVQLQRREQRDIALLNAVSFLAETYSRIYSSDIDRHEMSHATAPEEADGADEVPRRHTVKGRMDYYVDILERQVDAMSRESG
jgi:hypothetical protein